jgi:hypothetical protein
MFESGSRLSILAESAFVFAHQSKRSLPFLSRIARMFRPWDSNRRSCNRALANSLVNTVPSLGRFVFRHHQVTGLSEADSGMRSHSAHSRNHFDWISGDFVVDVDGACLVWYLGQQSNLMIEREIDAISSGCFNSSNSHPSVRFEIGSRMTPFGESVFTRRSSLQSICIPSSVATISRCWFAFCTALSDLIFDPATKVSIVGEYSFQSCSCRHSICIPSSVETIGKSFFR